MNELGHRDLWEQILWVQEEGGGGGCRCAGSRRILMHMGMTGQMIWPFWGGGCILITSFHF